MREPENREDYDGYDADGITVFLHKRVTARFPGRVRSLRFQIQGHGHFSLHLDRGSHEAEVR
jgi:hypothetical protein